MITGTESKPSITTPIPGPKAKAIVAQDDRYLVTTTKTAPVAGLRGRGTVVEDVDGNVLLDFAAGIGVLNVGHCHPEVVKAVQDQAAELMHFAGTDFYYDLQSRLGERLNQILPMGNTKSFFCQSGAEANEGAIKIAKAATGRSQMLAFQGAFHGRTQGALSLTASKTIQKEGFFPSMPGVVHVPYPAPFRNIWGIDGYEHPEELSHKAMDAIKHTLSTVVSPQDIAAAFWEPIQGEGGYHPPPPMFPKMFHEYLEEHDILLVADEVQTGFGRTGKWFASEHYGVKPDIMSIAKAMGSGLPIGATVVREDLDFNRKGRHSNTYGGNLVACAGSLATIDIIERDGLVEKSAQNGAYLGKKLDELVESTPGLGDSRGIGLMRAIDFVDANGGPNSKSRDAAEEGAWKNGIILLGCGVSGLRFLPPLNVSREQLDSAVDIVSSVVKQL